VPHVADRSSQRPSIRGPLAVVAVIAFIVLATLNSGGYRFGVGDQAFYLPAIQRHLQPDSFPRDRLVIDDQDRLNVFTRVAAGAIRATGVPKPALFLAIYAFSIALLAAGAFGIARALGLSPWAQIAVLAAMTLKHRVGLTGVNTLEGYAHPRMLAFALGVAGVVYFLRGRPGATVATVVAALVVHPTTALWFGVWMGVALVVSETRWRPWLLALAGLAAAGAAWTIGWGPLSPQLVTMDGAWLGVLASKDYLFATRWSLDMWAVAIACAAVPCVVWFVRQARGLAHPREAGMVAGLMALAAIFALTLPLVAGRIAVAVQFQISRVFWMLDFTSTIYAVWALADLRPASRAAGAAGTARALRATGEAGTAGAANAPARRPAAALAVAILLVCVSCARGAYVMCVEHPGRTVLQYDLPASDWVDAMTWLRRTPVGTHVIADPGHAWRYGTSVRVAAGRDVFFEEAKDTAMAIYSRRVAMRAVERIGAVGDFNALTPSSARVLASRFDLDYLVTTESLDLPVAHRNATFSIYQLRP
jgi:hypothetical protein